MGYGKIMDKYRLVMDDDGHWFICEANRYNDVRNYLESLHKYWQYGPSDTKMPEYCGFLEEINGPSSITFGTYTEN